MKEILIIEDDEGIRKAMQEVLEAEGHKVKLAHDGSDALTYLQGAEELPSIIFLDLMMPVMDGYEFRQQQVNDPRLLNIPTVILSAGGHVEKKAQEMGIPNSLKKPVDLDALFDLIEKLT